jgi:hypothetical protein
MNREQHRRQQFKKGITGRPLQQSGTLSIDYGHDGHNVVVMLTRPVDNLSLNEAQVDGMIEGLKTAKAALMAHKASAAREGGPGHG